MAILPYKAVVSMQNQYGNPCLQKTVVSLQDKYDNPSLQSSGNYAGPVGQSFPTEAVVSLQNKYGTPSLQSSGKSRKENPQKLTQLSSRSHPRYLVGKRTAQRDTIIDITSDSQPKEVVTG